MIDSKFHSEISELIELLKSIKGGEIKDYSKIVELLNKIIRIESSDISELLKEIKGSEKLQSRIDLATLNMHIVQHGAGVPYVDVGSMNLRFSLKTGEEKIFNFNFPDGYAGVIPYIEFESDVSKVKATCKLNLAEQMKRREILKIKIPNYILNRNTQIYEYELPDNRCMRYLPFMPMWNISISVRNDNTNYDANNVYISFPYIISEEKKIVNFYFNLVSDIFDIVKDMLLTEFSPIKEVKW